jgi:tripeptidyl-peptidase-1
LAKGAYGCLSGTSAATPVFAGMISLLNDEQVAAGKPTLGFINPVLYRGNGAIGFDVVEGNNKHQFCKAGFGAEKGYDAVTGWGTPVMQQLRQVLVGVSG